jgi:GNAT superfamily N-acetyltransferase
MIRKAQIHDWNQIGALGLKFYEEAQDLKGELIPEVFAQNWQSYIEAGYGHVFVSMEGDEVCGTIGGFLTRDPCNNDLVCTEAFWFVHPEKRRNGALLLRHWIHFAKESGARRMSMVHLQHLQSDRLAVFYQKLGFEPIEQHYIKEL